MYSTWTERYKYQSVFKHLSFSMRLAREEIPFRWNSHRWWKLNLLQKSQIQKIIARSMTAFNISNPNRIYCGGVEMYLHITKSEENVCLLWISGTWTKYFLCNYNRRDFIWIWKSTGVIYCMSPICKCTAINNHECGRRSYFMWDTFCKCVISGLWHFWLYTTCLTIHNMENFVKNSFSNYVWIHG